MSRIPSGVFGYFLVLTQVLVTEGDRATFEKAGMWDAEHQRIRGDGIFEGYWDGLDPSERRAVLTFFHEAKHHSDITSLPAGAFYWRVWDAVRRHGDLYVGFLRELNLSEHVQGTLREWLRTPEAMQLVRSRLAERSQFGAYWLNQPGRAAVLNDYCEQMLNAVDGLERVTHGLFRDPCPPFPRYAEALNMTAAAIHDRFLTNNPFQPEDYERVPVQEWVETDAPRPPMRSSYFMSFADIFELRAYAKELAIIEMVGTSEDSVDVLGRAKEALSANAHAVLERWVSEHYSPIHLQYITDQALGGRIDPNCGYYGFKDFSQRSATAVDEPRTLKVDFHRNWPSYRMAALLTHVIDDWPLLRDPDRAEVREHSEIGQYLFGDDSYPTTGLSLSTRGMIPRLFRGPLESPVKRSWNAADPTPWVDILVGNPKAEWSSPLYFQELHEVFAINQATYLESYCGRDRNTCILPRTYVLKDFVVGRERAPVAGNDEAMVDRGRLYATQSLLSDYLGAVVSTSIIEAEDTRVDIAEMLRNWGDNDFLAEVTRKVRAVYGEPFVQRFLSL
ncbi:hypothetical protein [Methylobacterium sp. 1973]|uniref:hypothetical protein n=1 Tax=Methylobacterium sp. 1973 TaxID=3156421 RepID=UPI0033908F2E